MEPGLLRDWRALVTGSLLLAALGCGGGGGGGNGPAPTAGPVGTPTALPPAPTPTAVAPAFTIATDLGAVLSPAVAWGAGRYLVAFDDRTANAPARVVALRLGPDGSVLDPEPLLLSGPAEALPFDPASAAYGGGAIAFAGDAFGVFYYGSGTARGDGPYGDLVGFTSVPSAGPLLAPTTTVAHIRSIAMARTFITPPVVAAASGARLLGIYQLGSQPLAFPVLHAIVGQHVTVSGGGITVEPTGDLGGNVFPRVDGTIGDSTTPGVASSASTTLVAWVELSVDERTFDDLTYSLAGSGDRFRRDAPDPSRRRHRGLGGRRGGERWHELPRRLERRSGERPQHAGGDPCDPGGAGGGPGGGDLIEPPNGFLVAGGASAKTLAGVAFTRGTYLVTWLEDRAIRGARVPEDATTVAPFEIDPGPSAAAALTAGDNGFLVVFERPVGDGAELVGRFVGATDDAGHVPRGPAAPSLPHELGEHAPQHDRRRIGPVRDLREERDVRQLAQARRQGVGREVVGRRHVIDDVRRRRRSRAARRPRA